MLRTLHLSEFFKNNQDKAMVFWGALGPFTILLTSVITLMKGTFFTQGFVLVAFLSIPICWKYKKMGLYLCVSVILFFTILLLSLQVGMSFWLLGVAFCTLISIIICHMTFEETAVFFQELIKDEREQLKLLQGEQLKMEEYFQKLSDESHQLEQENTKITEWLKEKDNLREVDKELINAIRQELKQVYYHKNQLIEELVKRDKDLSNKQDSKEKLNLALKDLKSQKDFLESKLLKLEKEQSFSKENRIFIVQRLKVGSVVQTSTISNSWIKNIQNYTHQDKKIRYLTQQLDKKVSSEISGSPEAVREFKRMQGLYKQLKQQFEDKTDLLHQTRKEIFAKDSLILELEKQQVLQNLDNDPLYKDVEKTIQQASIEVQEKEQELDILYAIIQKQSA